MHGSLHHHPPLPPAGVLLQSRWAALLVTFSFVILAVLAAIRSEEHTSELQSLMRISYAVFCLKTKRDTPNPASDVAPPRNTSPNGTAHASTPATQYERPY